MNFQLSRLEGLFAAAEAASKHVDVRTYEADLAAVLDYIQNNLDQRPAIAVFIIDKLMNSQESFEVSEYCMYELRWIEVYDAVIDWRTEEKGERMRYALDRFLGAFDQNWDGRHVYNRFAGEPERSG